MKQPIKKISLQLQLIVSAVSSPKQVHLFQLHKQPRSSFRKFPEKEEVEEEIQQKKFQKKRERKKAETDSVLAC